MASIADNIVIDGATEGELWALAGKLAELIGPGDTIALSGRLGAGKTSFARALIRAATRCPDEEVPSPTFTLAQPYESIGGFLIWHFDLYRLEAPEEALELGIEDAFLDAVSLVEWPEKLGPLLPDDHLAVRLAPTAEKGRRHISLSGGPSWSARLEPLSAGRENSA